ncbi:MAG: hypothetical protein HKN67_00750 [Saprospiraceae bacterium]|nr:hypothetical protein [Bacteroidia bacterium]NNF20442.1 hypothetical protein [Saprospiraceae bacterium]
MHIIIPILLQFYLLPIIFPVDKIVGTEEVVHIEIMNKQPVPFDFSIKYLDQRDQIHLRSAKPMESLRILNEDKKHLSYHVRGSNLIMLPRMDFKPGSYIAEVKFQKDPMIVLAKFDISEIPNPDDL